MRGLSGQQRERGGESESEHHCRWCSNSHLCTHMRAQARVLPLPLATHGYQQRLVCIMRQAHCVKDFMLAYAETCRTRKVDERATCPQLQRSMESAFYVCC